MDTGNDTIEIELGDNKVPFGLWKAIQEMRKGETSLIMVKPKYGYAHEKYAEFVDFPAGWKEDLSTYE